MNLFSIDLMHGEIQLLRQSLDLINISGKDAKFVANLQVKLEQELMQIQEMLKQDETKKQQELQDVLVREEKKSRKQQQS